MNTHQDHHLRLLPVQQLLDLKKGTPEEMIFDSGKHWLIDKRNAEGEALGWLNFNRALAKSDNVYFYEMGNPCRHRKSR